MNVTVNIDDDALSDLIKKGVDGLSEATIGDIAKKAVETAMSDPEVVKGLLFKRNSYSSSCWDLDLRPETVELLARSFSDEDLAKYRKLMLDTLDKAGDNLVIDALSRMLAHKLLDDQEVFMVSLQDQLRSIMADRG